MKQGRKIKFEDFFDGNTVELREIFHADEGVMEFVVITTLNGTVYAEYECEDDYYEAMRVFKEEVENMDRSMEK